MIKVKPLGYILSLIGIAASMGHLRETASEYVAPSEADPSRLRKKSALV
jgi:hypothetical protein